MRLSDLQGKTIRGVGVVDGSTVEEIMCVLLAFTDGTYVTFQAQGTYDLKITVLNAAGEEV